MNPSLMNYLQNQSSNQMAGAQSQPQQGMQSARPGQDSYNPFDAGIQKAISSARESLGMTADQEDAALRGSMLIFADNMSQQPRQKGFFNNFASVGKALSPAIQAHDQSEQAALAQNNALANQILAYQAAEQQKQTQQEERLWHRKHAENQLGEQRRYHNLMDDRMSHKKGESKKTAKEQRVDSSSAGLSNIFNNAEQLLTEDLENQETYRGRTSNLLSRFMPGGYIPTKKQAEVNALGDVLRGNLFNKWGYRNRAEFEHVPSISADNPPEVNLQIIQTLKGLLGNATSQIGNEQTPSQQNIGQANISSPNGLLGLNQTNILPDNALQNALQEGSNQDQNRTPYIWVRNDNTGEQEQIHPDDLATLQSRNKAWKKV